MTGRIDRRLLSTGDVLVMSLALAQVIVVSKDSAHLLPAEGPELLASARELVVTGRARSFEAPRLQLVSDSLRAIDMLRGGSTWP